MGPGPLGQPRVRTLGCWLLGASRGQSQPQLPSPPDPLQEQAPARPVPEASPSGPRPLRHLGSVVGKLALSRGQMGQWGSEPPACLGPVQPSSEENQSQARGSRFNHCSPPMSHRPPPSAWMVDAGKAWARRGHQSSWVAKSGLNPCPMGAREAPHPGWTSVWQERQGGQVWVPG